MEVEKFKELLHAIWAREISVEDAWQQIDAERERPDDYSKEYWLRLEE